MPTGWRRILTFFVVTLVATYSVDYLIKSVRGARKADMAEGAAVANLLMLLPGLVAVVFVKATKQSFRSSLGLRWTLGLWAR